MFMKIVGSKTGAFRNEFCFLCRVGGYYGARLEMLEAELRFLERSKGNCFA